VAEVISTSFPPSVKSKVYDALAVVVATVIVGEVIVAPEIVGEVIVLFVKVWVSDTVTACIPPCCKVVGFTVPPVIVLFVRVWVEVVPTTLPDTP
jgi:hypothetical protein